ncbi:ABC transporter substrate-binding protein [Corynebacterium otitidis]|uniref:Iron(III) transport system substrate-binding protein n=1 Tax=Corynebacterium otitidis ATCC 51513 TaxID=883169 RepID=I7KJG5_9CORY|nr:ABC transporter substrate-binding protein [Corynebacterium otitidis]EJZ82395.1 hypothetical protein HMPREF9719_00620 [Corynebacterium otitidis ATCC 51513]CCI83600.1 hypothetical protein BN46_0869 [Corynebacterium otitidis ATCC 51513]
MSLRPLTAAVAACGALTLAACSEPAADPEPTDTASGDETVTLTVYTSEPEDKVDEINAAFTEQNPDIDVEVYRAGTGDLKARIAAEQQAGEIGADILWAADSATFDTYAEDGVLADISDLDTSEVIEEARGTENYVGTRIIPTVIAYNENETEEADRPSSWQDLADPKYQDQIVMPDPAVSGAAAFNASVWRNEPSLGDDWFEALGENSPMIAESNGPTSQEVASGGHPYGVFVDYLARDLKEQGSPVEVIYPEEGAPFVTEPAGIFADSKNQDAAKKYLEFLISLEGQGLAVEQNYLPVREDAGTPEGAAALSEIELLTPDLEAVTRDQEAAVEAFQDAVKG